MEPTGNVVMRVVLSDVQGVVTGEPPYTGREFLSSTDERFRPVNGYTGPDGALYIVDMYRGVIQHKTYLTEYLERQIKQRGLEEPIDLGRIYRVVPTGAEGNPPQPRMLNASTAELVDHLTNANGWWRDTAQRLIVQRRDKTVAARLRILVSARGENHEDDIGRLHALWTLEGLGILRVSDLQAAAAASRHPKVHATVLRLAAILAQNPTTPNVDNERLLGFVETLAPSNREVSLQRVLALNVFREQYPDRVGETILAAAADNHDSPEFVDAIVGGLYGAEDVFLLAAESRKEAVPKLYAAVEQALFTSQLAPVLASLALADEHRDTFNEGRQLFNTHCAVCHGTNGKGLAGQAPSLVRSQWVLQDASTAARIVLDGLSGPISVNGRVVTPPEVLDVMPGFRSNTSLSDADVAAILTYTRNSWANRASAVSEAEVAEVRAVSSRAGNPWSQTDLASARTDGWSELTPDRNLAGWKVKGGTATYQVVDGDVIGTTVPDSPNTFLATERSYGDFVLEFEVLVDSLINSGVQIRSESRPDYQNGRVHGYQIEIDPSDRAWSAGIYDEGRRGWLFDLRGNPAARKAFRRDGWNHYRVEARGPHIRTWLNGVLAADLVDDMTPSGFIALQVHGVGSRDLVGRQIRWRNLRIREY
jgi:mono/diheme cytochrome c family protein